MEIREIRINQFGCWQQAAIPAPTTNTVNLIHLDDGGEATEFASFLRGMLFGFEREQPHEGSLQLTSRDVEFSLRRQSAGNGRANWQLLADDVPVSNRKETLGNIFGHLQPDVVENLFLPLDEYDLEHAWRWLEDSPKISNWLLGDQNPQHRTHVPIEELSRLPLQNHGRLIKQLAEQRQTIVAAIRGLRNQQAAARKLRDAEPHAETVPLRVVSVEQDSVASASSVLERSERTLPEPALAEQTLAQSVPFAQESNETTTSAQRLDRQLPNQMLIAELRDELRMLDRQHAPLEVANDLADRWRELNSLQQRTQRELNAKLPLADLRNLASTYRALIEEQREYDRVLTTAPKSRVAKKRKPSEYELRIRKLLDERDLVTEETTSFGTQVTLDAFTPGEEFRHAGELIESTQRDVDNIQRRIRKFTAKTNFNWQLLHQPVQQPLSRRELSELSPVFEQSPDRQLAELRRRRLWVREEYRWLVDQQPISSNAMTWITILFCLSAISVFSVLLVHSHFMAWTVTAFGFCGMVASYAFKLSIEYRNARQLARTSDRLKQLNQEIDSLAELIEGKNHLAIAEAKRKSDEKTAALQLQIEVTAAERRLESAELGFRELLNVHELPQTLTPDEAISWLQDRNLTSALTVKDDESVSSNENAKLKRWIKRARNLIQKVEGTRPGNDPVDLLHRLDDIFLNMRNNTLDRSSGATAKSDSVDKDFAREQLRRIAKQQRGILRKAKVEDDYGLDLLVEEGEQREEDLRKLNSLRLKLSVILESNEDGDDVRELLETLEANEIRTRLENIKYERQQIEDRIEKLSVVHTEAPKKVPFVAPVSEPVVVAEPIVHVEPTPTVTHEVSFDPRVQQELDRLRLRLNELDTRLRWTIKEAQMLTVARRAAGTTHAAEPKRDNVMPIVRSLTEGEFDSITPSRSGFGFLSDNESTPVEESLATSRAGWLALQLMAAEKMAEADRPMPLILYASELLQTSKPDAAYACLDRAARRGQQVFLLSDDESVTHRIRQFGAPVVRVGLKEEQSPQLRIASGTRRVASLYQRPDIHAV